MGDLIQRDDKIPVQARRAGTAEPEPIVIRVPAGQPVPVIPSQPGITQNIVYVVAPPAQMAPPPPASPPPVPQQIHYHTNHTNHTTNNYYPSKRRRERGTSYFGSLSLLFGILACATAYLPPIESLAQPIALGGMTLGVLGYLISVLFRRSRTGVPLIGILISATAYGMWLNNNGKLQSQYNQLKAMSPVHLPDVNFGSNKTDQSVSPPTLPPSLQSSPSSSSPKPPTGARHIAGDHSIFGDSGSWVNPAAAPVPATPNGNP